MPKYKQRCARCKKNFILMSRRTDFAVCWECQESELQGEITDPKMKKFFDIPLQWYKDNSFLRSIKVNYLRYGNLSERQVEAFEKVVKELKDKANTP